MIEEIDQINLVKNFAKQGKCEGDCDCHQGEAKPYKVAGWGYFSYCETAVKTDIDRGLILKELKE